eukprot:SAG11_NODE_11377_length_765_cov_0.702703_2_plen_22_part_01
MPREELEAAPLLKIVMALQSIE